MKTLIAILLILIFCAAGLGAGYFYEQQVVAPSLAKLAKAENVVKVFSSKIAPPLSVFGKVEKISGRVITLSNGGDSADITIKSDASVDSVTMSQDPKKGPTAEQKTAQFSDIKAGDTVNISVKVLASGELEGNAIIILAQ